MSANIRALSEDSGPQIRATALRVRQVADNLASTTARLDQVLAENRGDLRAFARLGETVMASPAKDVARDPVLIAGLLERFDLAHFLTPCLVDPYTSLISALTLTRRAASPGFTEGDREATEALTPHLVEAEVSSRLIVGAEASSSARPTAVCSARSWRSVL